jgi:predicted dienelactone hydrolase
VLRRIGGLATTVLLAGATLPLQAAEQLNLKLDGLTVPLDLQQLDAWSRDPDRSRNELAVWLNLLEPGARRDLAQLLRAPLLRDQSFGEQLLDSWSGEQLLAEVGQLLRSDSGAAPLRQTITSLLASRGEVTALDVLRAWPGRQVSLELDGVIELAQQWRQQLNHQRQALRQLRRLPLPRHSTRALLLNQQAGGQGVPLLLPVPHRREPLPLELWPARAPNQGAWVVLMPGLGGSAGQLGWLAAALSRWGWPVVVLEHPGSNAQAMKASLVGQRPPPGAESLDERLADLQAVLQAQQRGALAPLGAPAGQPVVLMGHSLGGVAALMGAGLTPEPGLARRCRQALRRLPLTNLSRLLQCQLAQSPPLVNPPQARVAAVVAFNGFGGLLWPRRGLERLGAPVLLVGGSLDLITPPLSEQLQVFVSQRHPRSRLALVEGGSHFSPVRLGEGGEALFQLGSELVGVDPRRAQELLLQITAEFLMGLQEPLLLSPQLREQNGVRAYVLDGPLARQWLRWSGSPPR